MSRFLKKVLKMKRFTTLVLILLGISACKSRPDNTLSGADDNGTLDLSNAGVLTIDGASNSRGAGATFSLEDRYVYHLLRPGAKSDLLQYLAKRNEKMFLSIDYFFPTNFTMYLDESATAKIESEVRKRVKSLLDRYTYVVLVNEFTSDGFYVGLKEQMSTKWGDSLKTIEEVLSGKPYLKKHLDIVNKTLLEIEKENNNLIVIDFANALVKPILTQIYNTSVPVRMSQQNMKLNQPYDYKLGNERAEILPASLSVNDMFAVDKIHINSIGQASMFNVIFRQILLDPRFSGVRVEPMTVFSRWSKVRGLSDYDYSSIIKFFGRSPADFAKNIPGRYKVALTNIAELSTSNATIQNCTDLNIFPCNELQTIRRAVASIAGSIPTGATLDVRLRPSDRGQVLNIDLTQALNYAKIDLVEGKNGHFTGDGSDYWTVARIIYWLDHIPGVYYHFDVTKSATGIEMTLYIIPTFTEKFSDPGYPSTSDRLTTVDDSVIRSKIADTVTGKLKHPYLKYKVGFKATDD